MDMVEVAVTKQSQMFANNPNYTTEYLCSLCKCYENLASSSPDAQIGIKARALRKALNDRRNEVIHNV